MFLPIGDVRIMRSTPSFPSMGIENFSFINQRSDVHKKRRLWITNSTEAGCSLHPIPTSIIPISSGSVAGHSGNHDMKNLRQNYTKYFELITMQMYIEVDKQKIYLNHCPFLCYSGSYDDTWQLFGHVHTSRNNIGKDKPRLQMLFSTQYDVGVDNNDFTPVSFAQVKAIIEKQVELSKK